MQHWLVKEYAKLVGNHLQIWSGSFTGTGGGGGLGLLKLQLQVLKKRRVLKIATTQESSQFRDRLRALPLLNSDELPWTGSSGAILKERTTKFD